MAESLGTVELGIKVEQDQATRDLRRFATTAERAGSEAAAGFKQLDSQLGITSTAVSALSTALGTLSVGEFLRQSIQAAADLETATRKLSNTLGEQGAASALSFTQKLADDLGLSFTTLTDTFGSFTAAATAANIPLETQKSLFAAVSKAAQQLGLSDDDLSGTLLALQQIASKGVVQMEELREQLGTRLPVASAAAAKGLGVTQQELIKLVESGKLTAAQFFPAFTQGLEKTISSTAGIKTTSQSIGELSNAVTALKVAIGTELTPTVVTAAKGLKELAAVLKDIAAAAKLFPTAALAQGIGIVDQQARDSIVGLLGLRKELKSTGGEGIAVANTFTQITSGGFGSQLAKFSLGFDILTAAAKRYREELEKRKQSEASSKVDPVAQSKAAEIAESKRLEAYKNSINSIDNLNARLKAQRDELNKVEIGSQRFQQLTQDIRGTEGQLNAATEAAKGTGAALANLRQQYSTSGLDLQSLQLNVGKERLALAQQLGQAEQDLANARFNTEDALLEAEKKRALEGVRSEAQRQQIEEEFQRRKEALEVKRLDYREQAAKREMALQERSMQLEARMTELAGQRSLLNAQRELAEARRTNDPEKIRIAEEGLRLVQEELSISRTISQEKIQGQKEINALRLKQISEERAAALADNLPPLPKPLQPAGNGIVEFKFDATPIDKNSNAVSDAAGQIGQSNTNLIQQISDNTAAVNNLVAKDWSVYAVLPDNPNPVPLLTP